ncbi:MAG: biopolymer transporter ExbD [Verrucomicrobiota bacterium]
MALHFRRREDQPVELQIAPMADIGFLLLCFFIVSSKPPRHEADLGMTLPGSVSDEVSVEIPEEVRIAIRADGSVEVNEAVIAKGGDHDMKSLVSLLMKFKEAADLNHNKALVTVDAVNETTHQRIVDVLNCCGIAGISGVTLSDDTEETAGI